jgi:hypothetical protein
MFSPDVSVSCNKIHTPLPNADFNIIIFSGSERKDVQEGSTRELGFFEAAFVASDDDLLRHVEVVGIK